MKIIVSVALLAASLAVQAQVKTVTRQDGSVQTIIPVTERQCKLRDQANLGNAALGGAIAGAGAYSTAKIAGSRSSGAWGLAGMAVGALIGATTQPKQDCFYVDVTLGYRVITVKDGRVTESFIPSKAPIQ